MYRVEIEPNTGLSTKIFVFKGEHCLGVKIISKVTPSEVECRDAVNEIIKEIEAGEKQAPYLADIERKLNDEFGKK